MSINILTLGIRNILLAQLLVIVIAPAHALLVCRGTIEDLEIDQYSLAAQSANKDEQEA